MVPVTIAGFALALAGSLAARVIMSLGLGWVSYKGIMEAIAYLKTQIDAAFSTASPVIDLLLYAGMGHAVGILLAAITTRGMIFGFAQLGKALTT